MLISQLIPIIQICFGGVRRKGPRIGSNRLPKHRMPSTVAEVSPNNLELRKLSVHANPPDVSHFMNSRNFDNSNTHVPNSTINNNDDAIPSTSTQHPSTSTKNERREKSLPEEGDEEEFQPKLLPPSPFYNLETELDESGPSKVRRLSPKTVAEISRFDRHTILFSAMVAPSRSRVSSPVRRLLSSRDPCTSAFQPSTISNENGQLSHNIESKSFIEFGFSSKKNKNLWEIN